MANGLAAAEQRLSVLPTCLLLPNLPSSLGSQRLSRILVEE